MAFLSNKNKSNQNTRQIELTCCSSRRRCSHWSWWHSYPIKISKIKVQDKSNLPVGFGGIGLGGPFGFEGLSNTDGGGAPGGGLRLLD